MKWIVNALVCFAVLSLLFACGGGGGGGGTTPTIPTARYTVVELGVNGDSVDTFWGVDIELEVPDDFILSTDAEGNLEDGQVTVLAGNGNEYLETVFTEATNVEAAKLRIGILFDLGGTAIPPGQLLKVARLMDDTDTLPQDNEFTVTSFEVTDENGAIMASYTTDTVTIDVTEQ